MNAEARKQFSLENVAYELDNTASLESEMQAQLMFTKLDRYGKPLFVTGPSGAGKTGLMAQVAQLCDNWFERKPVRVLRFCGTTPHSTHIVDLLVSICEQIWKAYEIESPQQMDLKKDYAFLVEYFRALLYTVNTEHKPLILIIDSLDQLSHQNNPQNMRWLPEMLPPNVYILLSVMTPENVTTAQQQQQNANKSRDHSLLSSCQYRIADVDRYIDVPIILKDTGAAIVKQWMKVNNRYIFLIHGGV